MAPLERGQIEASLIRREASGASPESVVEAIVTAWREIDAALSSVIGRQGVAALYARCLHIAAPTHPWLAPAQPGMADALDLAALRSALSSQSSADAAAGGAAILQEFDQLLASMIGHSLTGQLLRPVWANHFSTPPSPGTQQ